MDLQKPSINRQSWKVSDFSPRYLIKYNRLAYMKLMAHKSFKSIGGSGRLQNKTRIAFTARHKFAVVVSIDELGDMCAVICQFYPNMACSRFGSRKKLKISGNESDIGLNAVRVPFATEKKQARSLGVATILSSVWLLLEYMSCVALACLSPARWCS